MGLDECDKMLSELDMRKDVQEIFRTTPHEKQVMMFSATLSKDIRPVCKKFMQDPMEVYIDDEAKLTLHGLQQHYVKLKDSEKNRKLFELLDVLEFNQVVIFVKSVQLRRTGSTVDRTEFPRHSNPQGYDTGGETLKVPTVQGFPEKDSCRDQPVW